MVQTDSERKDNACNAMVYEGMTRKERAECVKQEERWRNGSEKPGAHEQLQSLPQFHDHCELLLRKKDKKERCMESFL